MSNNTFVLAYQHLKGRPHEERALPLLLRVASLVKPIMRKHGWTLPLLTEFFPKEDNLVGMNMNAGQKIFLRLRPARAPDTFYEDEDIIGTMLHELAHNIHGPHDEKFYKLLSELEEEYYELQRNGYSGEGFFTEGKKLGGSGGVRNVPPHLARQKALEAAERRRKAGLLSSGSGQALGGGKGVNLSPRELAARASERRARDERACGSNDTVRIEAERAARDGIVDKADPPPPPPPKATSSSLGKSMPGPNDVIDIDDLDSDASLPPVHPRKRRPENVASASTSSTVPKRKPTVKERPPSRDSSPDIIMLEDSHFTLDPKGKGPALDVPASRNTNNVAPTTKRHRIIPAVSDDWTCLTCTFINTTGPLSLQCHLCHAPRPSKAWTCLQCGEEGMDHNYWTCRACGWMKKDSGMMI